MSKPVAQRAVDEAVRRVGSPARLAKLLGITRQAIQQWKSVPPERVLALENISGVSRYELRPDIYGPPPKKEARAA